MLISASPKGWKVRVDLACPGIESPGSHARENVTLYACFRWKSVHSGDGSNGSKSSFELSNVEGDTNVFFRTEAQKSNGSIFILSGENKIYKILSGQDKKEVLLWPLYRLPSQHVARSGTRTSSFDMFHYCRARTRLSPITVDLSPPQVPSTCD